MIRMQPLFFGVGAVLGVLAVAGCAGSGLPGSAPAAIATVQPGDDQLTCAQLTTQMGQMDQIIANASANTTGTVTNAAAQGASGVTGALSGVGQALGDAASGVAGVFGSSAAQQQAVQSNEAQQRKQALMTRYTQNKC